MQPSRCGLQALRIGDVAGDDLGPERGQLRSTLGSPGEGPDVVILGQQGLDDRRPDEPGAAGHEDLHDSKFCQYRDGVGPRWPWYFEPSEAVPYGLEVGSLSCMNEIWPIFIPW